MFVSKYFEPSKLAFVMKRITCFTICVIVIQYLWISETFDFNRIQAKYLLENHTLLKNVIEDRHSFSKTENLLELARKRYTINCSNIEDIKLGRKLGMGNFKTTFIGYFRGMKVAVKVPNENLTVDALNVCVKRIFAPV